MTRNGGGVEKARYAAAVPQRILHQFPVSHFCEKTRWHLDAKGLSYRVRNLFPGQHAKINKRLVGRSSVPVLIDGQRVVHDSSNIALYLESAYPGRALVPTAEAERARVLELETFFDEEVGPPVRHWAYACLLRRPGLTTRAFFRGYGLLPRAFGRLVGEKLEATLRRFYPGDEASVATAEQKILAGMDQLERALRGRTDRFLVGNALTVADLAAAALFGPVVLPPGSPWTNFDWPPELAAMSERLAARPGGQWVRERYARDRHAR